MRLFMVKGCPGFRKGLRKALIPANAYIRNFLPVMGHGGDLQIRQFDYAEILSETRYTPLDTLSPSLFRPKGFPALNG